MATPRKPKSDTDPPPGIACRKCGCEHHHVFKTRQRPGVIVRWRECRHCGHRFVTRET